MPNRMRVLFVHRDCPAQFRHLAAAFGAADGNRIAFVAERMSDGLTGAEIVPALPVRRSAPPTHHYLQALENEVLLGQAAYRACLALRGRGFVPDVIYAHAGFGTGLYLRDAFPDAALIGYFEWYYRAHGSDADFLSDIPPDEALRIRTRNAGLLLELVECDRAICPTHFQQSQFPAEFRDKLSVLHDGIDVADFTPGERGRPAFAPFACADDTEIVTFSARGLEPYRGFPQFMRALSLLLDRRPKLHAVIAGGDDVHYGPPCPGHRTWREAALHENPDIDKSRVHFLGWLDGAHYRSMLQASHAHVYLTVPFVPSWSLLEAMASGCTVIGSDTAPVREFLTDGATGMLADFHDPAAIARRISEALDHRQRSLALGAAARRHVVQNYSLDRLLPRHHALAESALAEKITSSPPPAAAARGPDRDPSATCTRSY